MFFSLRWSWIATIAMMDATTFNCLSCGAAVSSDNPTCRHCGARVATMACPCCFRMSFRESKFCSQCGEPTVPWQPTSGALPCPGCETPLLTARVGATKLYQCARCFGFWIDRDSFEQVCRNSRMHAVVARFSKPPEPKSFPEKIRYFRCPGCRQLMNRVNFAEYSGIVVDVCREHGTWFEVNELQNIVDFLRSGGMELIYERRQAELASVKRRLNRSTVGVHPRTFTTGLCDSDGPRIDVIPELIRLVGSLFRKRH